MKENTETVKDLISEYTVKSFCFTPTPHIHAHIFTKSLLSLFVSEVLLNYYLVNTNYNNSDLGITAFERKKKCF
jgi:hypothetical protein